MQKIGGTPGNLDGIKIGYKVMDYVFDPELVLNYTWTGISRTSTEKRIAFSALEGVVDVFFHVIYAADDHHTTKKK